MDREKEARLTFEWMAGGEMTRRFPSVSVEAIARKRLDATTKSATSLGPNGPQSGRFHRAAFAHGAIEIRRFRAIVYI